MTVETQTSGLDALAGAAASVDAEALGAAPGADRGPDAPGAAPGAGPQSIPTAQQLRPLLAALAEKATEKFPKLGEVWTADAVNAFADALGPLLDKYGVDSFGFLEAWRVELMAAFVCVPLIWATLQIIRADLEAAQQKKEKQINPRDGSTAYDPHAPPKSGPNAPGAGL